MASPWLVIISSYLDISIYHYMEFFATWVAYADVTDWQEASAISNGEATLWAVASRAAILTGKDFPSNMPPNGLQNGLHALGLQKRKKESPA
jgi:hypothetical protein